METPVIEIKDLSVSFGDNKVLEDINLRIGKNTFLGIIGPNGGGKTTLVKAILGLIKPKSGKITILGKDPKNARSLIGYVPQNTGFDHSFPISVFETVLMGRYTKALQKNTPADIDACRTALERVDLLEFSERRLGELSGGQVQRVFVARALARNPMILLLDEPASGIDPKVQASFYELLSRLKESMTIIMVTHDISVVSTYVDEVACLNRRLYYHNTMEGGIEGLEEAYQCPIDLITHGRVPHRVLKTHKK